MLVHDHPPVRTLRLFHLDLPNADSSGKMFQTRPFSKDIDQNFIQRLFALSGRPPILRILQIQMQRLAVRLQNIPYLVQRVSLITDADEKFHVPIHIETFRDRRHIQPDHRRIRKILLDDDIRHAHAVIDLDRHVCANPDRGQRRTEGVRLLALSGSGIKSNRQFVFSDIQFTGDIELCGLLMFLRLSEHDLIQTDRRSPFKPMKTEQYAGIRRQIIAHELVFIRPLRLRHPLGCMHVPCEQRIGNLTHAQQI